MHNYEKLDRFKAQRLESLSVPKYKANSRNRDSLNTIDQNTAPLKLMPYINRSGSPSIIDQTYQSKKMLYDTYMTNLLNSYSLLYC